jgi:signal transduction histidine kinase
MRTQPNQPSSHGLSPVGVADVLSATLKGAHTALACWELGDDGDLYLVAANARYLEFVGRPEEDLIGQRLREAIPVIRDEAVTLMHHVLSSGEPLELSRFVRRTSAGENSYWDMKMVPVGGEGPRRLVVSAHDVTEQTGTEDALSEQNLALQERTERESIRLEALARIAGAAAAGGGSDAVLAAIAEGVKAAFGLETVVNVLDDDRGVFVVRAGSGGGVDRLVGSTNPRDVFEEFLDPRFEVIRDVYFVPHEAHHPTWEKLGENVLMPVFGWRGPGYWHPEDACFVRLRTSEGKDLGILSVDSPTDQPIPNQATFELLRLFAMVGANASENLMLVREIDSLEAERAMQALRRELEEEVGLHRSLLEIGNRLGLASAEVASREIFPLIVERLAEVVPIQSATVSRVDHDTRKIRPIYHSEPGPIADAMLAFEIPFGVGATGKAVLEQKSCLDNADGAQQVAVDVPGTSEEDEHVLAVPVMVDEQVRAALTLHRPATEAPYTAADARRAELFGQHIMAVLLLVELAETGRELDRSRKALADQVEQLESLNRMKDEFVANVSHELRTPLTAVIGNVATVARSGDLLAPEERHEMLEAAERQAKRLSELLENLLATSRLADQDPPLVPMNVELSGFAQEIADGLRQRAIDRDVAVEADPIEITTDPTLLYRILYNLGDNAMKYSDREVRIRVRRDGEGVRIEVRDRGIGIAPEDIPRVFERFEQLESSRAHRVGGVGLGLYLSARAAQALGGRIEVESEVGMGSTFSLWLPLHPVLRSERTVWTDRDAGNAQVSDGETNV